MNERFDIRSELEDHIIPDIDPRARSNITAALEVTFQLFDDYQDSAEGYCDTKTLYFITNGHVQCGECVCTDDRTFLQLMDGKQTCGCKGAVQNKSIDHPFMKLYNIESICLITTMFIFF